ncbi:MAG: DNA-binding protein WhiA [Clostridia bacterium]|nr:DNA-binding protein WhiA [Clostridia bacterium]
MSFATEQKMDIIAQPIKNKCCKRALLFGVITSRGRSDGDTVSAVVDSRITADYVSGIVHDIYGKDGEVSTLPGGGRGYLISFRSKTAAEHLSEFLSGGEAFSEKCQMCHSSYLRGVFLASGRVTDPTKQYLLEFSLKDKTERFLGMFEDLGLLPKVSKKPKETVIYFKNSSSIEDFFALAGMNNATFALMNAKIQGEIRNNVNRVANCETNNINKAVSASVGHIAVINELIETGLISMLPDELRKTALLRVEHSDLSLSQLAALITPYISKPGLSHRLKRIAEIGTELLGKAKKKT